MKTSNPAKRMPLAMSWPPSGRKKETKKVNNKPKSFSPRQQPGLKFCPI